MNLSTSRYAVVGLFSVVVAACGGSSPAQPSSTPSVTAPRPLQPATNASILNASQPVTLVVQNAVVTQSGGTTYTFEVATDLAFATKVQTKDGVAEGSGGQTSVKLDTLAPATTYYWHARAQGGGTTGVYGTTFSFKVGPAITINAPVPIAPLTNTQTYLRPAFRVTNATRTGPAGTITYTFEISTVSTFATLVTSGTVAEGVNETGFIPSSDLPSNGLLYWRATAIDAANGITSAPSAVQSFTADKQSQAALVAAQEGLTLWPGAQPPGTPGQATMGSDWTVEYITSFDGVRFLNPPIEELQIFDLLDRGFDPQGAIDWMNSHGYQAQALWYPDPGVIAFRYEYIFGANGVWNIVIRAGA